MNERSHCPYLGLRQNRAIRFASPTAEHRCYVSGEAQDIPVDQRAYCLSINHLSCPLYTGEWSATTTGALAGSGAMALPRSGVRGRLSHRDYVFYLAVVGLVATITLVWVGIYALYTLNNANTPAVAPIVRASATVSATTAPTPTRTPKPATATPDAKPSAPAGLTTGGVSLRGVLLNWKPNTEPDFAGYNVYRAAQADGPFTKLNERLLAAPLYEDDGPPAGTTVYYRVMTVDAGGHESDAATISVTTPEKPTAEPTATPAPTATTAPTPTERVVVVPGPPIYVPAPTAAPPAPTKAPPEPTAAPPTEAPPPPTTAPTDAPTVAPTDAPTVAPTDPPPPTAAPTDAPAPSAGSAPSPTTASATVEPDPTIALPTAAPTIGVEPTSVPSATP